MVLTAGYQIVLGPTKVILALVHVLQDFSPRHLQSKEEEAHDYSFLRRHPPCLASLKRQMIGLVVSF
jgi:hypothetical protein